MSEITTADGTVTLNHEWPVPVRVEAFSEGLPIVSLELDTEYGTAVVALNMEELEGLVNAAAEWVRYYQEIGIDLWNSR